MIELTIFYLHFLGGLYGFTKRWQQANVREGILATLIFGLAFTILWSLTGPLARLIVPDSMTVALPGPNNTTLHVPGYAPWFTRDTLSLVLVAIPDAVFFYIFFLREKRKSAA